ncbi:MAG: protein phosphatase 2C domain-containing protein [Terriglobia bacterium]
MSTVDEAKAAEQNAINVRAFGVSDMGRVRKNNEDNFVVCNLTTGEVGLTPPLRNHTLGNRGSLFMVADGMGGEASGEVASQICALTVPKRLYENLKSLGQVSETNFVLLLRESIEYANQIIHQKAQSNPLYRGMGTTATVAALFGPYLFVAQVGDSRAYLIRNSVLTQLTRDQTFLNYLKEIGVAVPADPEMDSRRSILTQAVGSSESVNVKVTYTKVRQGDSILLCSDGLYNMVPATDIVASVKGTESLANKCKSLIDKANAKGGSDNITVVMAEFSGPGLSPAAATAAVEFKEFNEEDFKGHS